MLKLYSTFSTVPRRILAAYLIRANLAVLQMSTTDSEQLRIKTMSEDHNVPVEILDSISTDSVAGGTDKRKLDECSTDVEFSPRKKKITRHVDRPGMGEEKYDETEYYFENGLRRVYPYNYTYTSFCKQRWVGQQILNIFSDEFRLSSRDSHKSSLEEGRMTVNGQSVDENYVLQENDLIANNVHRHEIPVLAAAIKVIYQSNDWIIVDKPPSIPVHPCGRFRNNTATFILGKENGLRNLHTLHRLDRLTSGLLMFTQNKELRRKVNTEIANRKVTKEYVCRVEGEFPDDKIVCNEPLEKLSPKLALYYVCPDGKSSTTEFKKLSYNGRSSVLSCLPLTGRTHQIRVHLQFLGFPILNDSMYNTNDFGPSKGKGGDFGKSKDDLVKKLTKSHNAATWFASSYIQTSENTPTRAVKMSSLTTAIATCLNHYSNDGATKLLEEKYKFEEQKLENDAKCPLCKEVIFDPAPEDMMIFLHALRYKGDGWEFETEMPVWAKEEWNEC